jgi:IS30 family transposase/transposase InsO family protein
MADEGLPVQAAARVLGVSESGYYDWRGRPPSPRSLRHAWLTDTVSAVHVSSYGTYGARRVHAELRLGHGIVVSHGTVELMMRRAGLKGLPGHKRRRPRPETPTSDDLVHRDFARPAGDQLWVSDITEHPTREGKVYCAVVLDTHSRRVVGWSIDSAQTAALVTNALGMAISKPATCRNVDPLRSRRAGRIQLVVAAPRSRRCAMGRGGEQLPGASVGARRQWAADRALRPPMRSPGRPEPSRAVQRDFWRLIASGVTTVEAAEGVGVSWPVGVRWFRHAGGMPPISLDEPTGRYLSFAEREEIALLRAQEVGVREIARRIGRDPGTVSRELRRNAATRGGKRVYRALVAQWKAQQAAKRPKAARLAGDDTLREYVQERLAGAVRRPDGTAVAGPQAPVRKGLSKPHRQDRRWAMAWSPEQISHRLPVDFPDDGSMRISHEAIYQSLFIAGRGALKRELVACLRTGRALQEPRARSRNKPQGHVSADVVLSERPAEAADRAVPGHWEGDLIIGTGRSAIGTLVERSSRSTLLVHLPRQEGWGEEPPVRNGPSLGGYGAIAMSAALASSITQLPQQLRRTLTWDRGKELSGHAQLTLETGTRVFFADPHSPWQRPTNENTNGLLRQYFPKGTDLSRWSAEDLDAVALTINNRPRKTLHWKTPAEAFTEQLRSLQQPGVASTG